MTNRSAVTIAAATAAVLVCATPALAQRWQVDVTGNRIGYDTTGQITSASIAPLLEWTRPDVYAILGGAFGTLQGGQWTTQGHGDLSLLFAPVRALPAFRTELVGSADGTAHAGGYNTTATHGEFRLHLAGPAAGAWIGAAASTGWTTGATGIATSVGPTAGAWARNGAVNAMTTWTPYRLDGYWYQQFEGRLSTSVGRVDLMGYAGWRGAPAATGIPNASWGGASASVWITNQLAVVFAGGSYASDLLQALPRGTYFSAGVRLSRLRPSVWAGTSAPPALYAPAHGDAVLHFRVRDAAQVAIVGDWTAWKPVPLERGADDEWIFRAHLASGVHRSNLVVDGTRWIVPDGVTAVDDGFGGKISLLVVP